MALALALTGCGALLDADFDRPSAKTTVLDPSEPKSVVPAQADGTCPPARRRCGDACALIDDPAFGCNEPSCVPCAIPPNGVAMCTARLTCDFTCEAGFEKIDGRCVGFRLEADDVPELYAVAARAPNEVYVAGSNFYAPPQVLRSNGDGKWTPQTIDVVSNRMVTNFAVTESGAMFLGTYVTPGGQDGRLEPILARDLVGRWVPQGAGTPAIDGVGNICALSNGEIFALRGQEIRHYLPKHGWTTEQVGVSESSIVFTMPNGGLDFVYAIDPNGTVMQRQSNGAWIRRYTPTADLGILAVTMGEGGEVWLVGHNGLVMSTQTSFATFTTFTTPTTDSLRAVWAKGSEVWAVGLNGTMIHSASGERKFERVASHTNANLMGIWGSGPNDIYVVGVDLGGYSGVILHRH
jgi:hypothetical protein